MESTLEILTGAEMYDPNNYPSPERVQIASMILELERRMLAESLVTGRFEVSR